MAIYNVSEDCSVQVYDQTGYHSVTLSAGTYEVSDADAALALAYVPQCIQLASGVAPAPAAPAPVAPVVAAPEPAAPAPADVTAPAPSATPNEV